MEGSPCTGFHPDPGNSRWAFPQSIAVLLSQCLHTCICCVETRSGSRASTRLHTDRLCTHRRQQMSNDSAPDRNTAHPLGNRLESSAVMKICTPAGPALSLLPLILFRTRTPMSLAVGCLAAFMGLQAFCYAGFHAYVQVTPELIPFAQCCCGKDCLVAGLMHTLLHWLDVDSIVGIPVVQESCKAGLCSQAGFGRSVDAHSLMQPSW